MARRIGLDIGALYLKAVCINGGVAVEREHVERHRGQPAEALARALEALGVNGEDRIAVTGCNGEALAAELGVPYRDTTLCQLEAVRLLVPGARAIMDVGGGSASLITLDEQGRFEGHASNSLCAAGTGSFLDEQAGRLGITHDEAAAFRHNPDPPSVAARCSVFAKSDLIHRQQEGYGKADMWCGLCRGMTRTLLGTLLSGRPLQGRTALIGGVARNPAVVRWLQEANPGLIEVPEHPHLIAALGAALHAGPAKHGAGAVARGAGPAGIQRFPWRLTLERSTYPSFETQETYETADGSEVRVIRWAAGEKVRCYLGIDIGSTSTKAVLVDEEGEVVADVYRKTSGDPIGATKLLFSAIRDLAAAKGSELEVLGAGTTGSGRKIVGAVVGADAVINEISSHVAGAARVDPTIDTIFEIGGQDAKYMHLVDGHIRDASMNYVCAAGTGSFVEEQAIKLGYRVAEAGPAVLGITPPRATDRCTVFMEQDMAKLIQEGATPQEAFAAVMVAVVRNYLNKVVGNRHRSRSKIFFQGATARNPALVAAFERLLDVEMVVSPFCHVMGSWGVALLTRDLVRARGAGTTFRGLDLDRRSVSLRKETCTLCQNRCSITFADIEGEARSPSWGYLCGREPGERRVRTNSRTRLLRARQKLWREAGALPVPEGATVVGIPQALSTWIYLPLWRRFFNRLGCRVELSGSTTPEIRELGGRVSGAEFCFPAKVFLGHATSLAQRRGADLLFLPQMKREVPNEHATTSAFCPYVQASPAYTKAAFAVNALAGTRVLAPVVDRQVPERTTIDRLFREVGRPLGRSRREVAAAWREALGEQRAFEEAVRAEGRAAVAEAREKGEKLLVLVGRPYNIYDPGLNLGLPEKLAEHGRTVIPLDMLDLDLARLGETYRNTYWSLGQKILAALAEVAGNDLLDAVYFTNFGCGPDSFLLSYAADTMGAKPFLALELDEHGSDTGYVTRIEAFFDVLRRQRSGAAPRTPPPEPAQDFRGRTIWVPNMHPYSTEIAAAALRSHGYAARPLPLETEATFELGRSVTRGSECLPTALTIGSLLAAMRAAPPGERHAFFMPTAQGPCRFGQYIVLHRQILDREGFGDVPILSPSHYRAFAGIEEGVRRSFWKGMLAGDTIMKAVCKVRPYEREEGAADRIAAEEAAAIAAEIERGGDGLACTQRAVRRLAQVPVRDPGSRPLVGIVGEIYVRNNLYANEDVVRAVERFGGEAWPVPLAEWILFTSSMPNVFDDHSRRVSPSLLRAWVKLRWLHHWERRFAAAASPFLDDRHDPPLEEVLGNAQPWMPVGVGGEANLTVGRAISFQRQGVSMIVNVAPFGCMPGSITTAIFRQISAERGLPVANLFYDGAGAQNRRLEVALRALAARS